jgi:hypothetical protein
LIPYAQCLVLTINSFNSKISFILMRSNMLIDPL